MSKISIPQDQSREFVSRIFQKLGASKDHADTMGDHLTMAELRGVYSHGLIRIKSYVEKVQGGGYRTNPNIQFIKKNTTSAVLDADNGFGPVTGKMGMEYCIKTAKEQGTGSVIIKNSNHWGFLAYYPLMALKEDMIAFICCNAGTTTAIWGSTKAFSGTSPFCAVIPSGRHYPLVLDLSCSMVAQGKIMVAGIEGKTIPDTWAYDKNGNPTTDPKAALEGSMRPFGDYKGSSIAIIISLLTSGLAGMPIDIENTSGNDPSKGNLVGGFMNVIDISKFQDLKTFKEHVDHYIDLAKQLPKSLPEQVQCARASEEELKSIAPHLDEFCKIFSVDRKAVDGDFFLLRPNSQNHYKQLYTAT
jgi:LDH2 family malate/lactate/ureidoglycolate dehydrogenase